MNERKTFSKFLKIVFYLGNLLGIIWWAVHSIDTYNQWPTSSNYLLQYGEDGKGNVRFPVITICPQVPSLTNLNSTLIWNNQPLCKKVDSYVLKGNISQQY